MVASKHCNEPSAQAAATSRPSNDVARWTTCWPMLMHAKVFNSLAVVETRSSVPPLAPPCNRYTKPLATDGLASQFKPLRVGVSGDERGVSPARRTPVDCNSRSSVDPTSTAPSMTTMALREEREFTDDSGCSSKGCSQMMILAVMIRGKICLIVDCSHTDQHFSAMRRFWLGLNKQRNLVKRSQLFRFRKSRKSLFSHFH